MSDTWAYLIILPIIFSLMYFFFSSPLKATMYIIAFQKLIDILWFVRVKIGPFVLSVQRIAYTVIPIVLLGVIAFEAKRRNVFIRMTSLKIIMIAYLLIFAVSVLRSPYIDSSVELFFKAFAGLIAFFAGWYYFDNEEKFDEFAKLYIITYLIPFSGLILQVTGIFQLSDIGINQQVVAYFGVEDLNVRYAGFYNDSGTNTMYLWTLIPLSFYFVNKQGQGSKWLYIMFLLIAVIAVVIGFARTSYLIFGTVVASWLFINKNYLLLLVMTMVLFVYFLVGDFLVNFFSDLVHLYKTGKFLSVSGKAVMWDVIMEDFDRRDVAEKLFGMGMMSDGALLMNVYGANRPLNPENNWYAYRYNVGYLGWLLYIGIPLSAMFIVLRNIRVVNRCFFDKNLLLKYHVFFSILCGYFVSLFGRGDQWVSATMPLWFVAGFALKYPAFYVFQRRANNVSEKYLVVNRPLSFS